MSALARARARYAAQSLVEPFDDVQYWELVGGRVRLAAEPRTRRANHRAAAKVMSFVGFDWPSAGNAWVQR